jgi:hypothetical protein
MTDPHRDGGGELTFWQSPSDPSSILISFPLGKLFQISRVAVTFHSAPPESLAVLKSADGGESFVPFHYFSLFCEATYGVVEGMAAGQEPVALCSSPEAGGAVVFEPLQPSEGSPQEREWALATDLRLRLDRLQRGAHSYAISDVAVAGTCFCHGHAAGCRGSVAAGDVECECEHGTAGRDCSLCLSSHQDVPWAPATADDPASCVGEWQ